MREVVLTVGFPASGKSSHVASVPEYKNYVRLNRDELGGQLSGVAVKLAAMVKSGEKSFLLDNTYGTIESRAEVIKIAKAAGLRVKCVWLKTTIEEAQFNACSRMYSKYQKVLDPAETKQISKKDPNSFPVVVLFAYQKSFEPPTPGEGFDEIVQVKFKRNLLADYVNKALILDYDGTLRTTKSGEKFPRTIEDIEVLPGRKEVLEEFKAKGFVLAGVSNQSGVGKGVLTAAQAEACLLHVNKVLDVNIDVMFCPHNSFPIACYCRKPMPGLGVHLIHKYKLDPSKCIMVGDMTSDKTFAKRCGFKYVDADALFANAAAYIS